MSSSPLSGKIVGLSLVIAVVAVAFLGFVAYAAMSQRSSQAATVSSITTMQSNTPSTIMVPGSGTASGQPDEVQIVLGITNTGLNASKVLQQNSANMSMIISALEEGLHINGSDIMTTQFNFNANYNCCNVISNYQATNMIQITLRGGDMAKLDSVINAAVNAGANQIQNIQYLLSNALQTQLKQQALQQAVADANQTALRATSSENVKIAEIQSVVVLGENYPQPYYNNGFGNLAGIPAVDYNVPLAPGQTQYTLQVEVTYLLG
jgi:uncharacterized protein